MNVPRDHPQYPAFRRWADAYFTPGDVMLFTYWAVASVPSVSFDPTPIQLNVEYGEAPPLPVGIINEDFHT